jgi:hypothetical protein
MALAEPLFVLHESVVLRDDDRVCFHKETGCVLRLNDSAYAILLHFERPIALEQVARSFEDIFYTSGQTATEWVREFASYLTSINILRAETR